MNKLMMLALTVCSASLIGCKSIEVNRHAQSLATIQNADGTVSVVKDALGNPLVLDGGWDVDYFQHWNWQKFDSLHATAGSGVALDINNYEGGSDATNLTHLVDTSLKGITSLVTAAADAYVKVAGGKAQVDTALDMASRIINYFSNKGGDISKATVEANTADNTVKVTDGSITINCDVDGNCTDCTVK